MIAKLSLLVIAATLSAPGFRSVNRLSPSIVR